MGKTVIAEESVSDYVSSLFGTQTWRTGLILGQMGTQKYHVVHLTRTPEQTNSEGSEEDAAPSKVKPSSPDKIDESWFIEHARQVSRMLVGGLDIIGIFIFGPPDMLSKAQTKVRQLLYSLYKATYLRFSAFFDPEDLVHTRVILQICSKTKKVTCRTLDMSDNKSTAQPAEYKYQSFLSRWNTLDTKISLDYKFNVPVKMEKADLNTKIMEGLQSYLQDISSSVCTINGQLPPDDQLLVPSDKQTKSSQLGSCMTVDVYLNKPFLKESKKPKESKSCGVIQVVGSFHCTACLNQKITNREAIQAIKYDIIRSVISRCEVLCDDIVDAQEDNSPESSIENIWTCPRRVFVPLGKTPVRFCDYVFQDETMQDSLDRISELLDMNPREDEVQSLETMTTNQNLEEIKEHLQSRQEMERDSSEEQSDSSTKTSSVSARILGVVLGLATAVIATGVAFIWGEQAS
ncbi:protein odr-4 homolog [Actinia tenebrosa]|uniref:Protein odr-4 homolog n=1 Tax=Actinia tenebrosa TaxID=6105 RepID=A0A6P8HQ85_ACTTE|nr:protein odr-4 homolog [Actinia tenebrosa]